MSFQRTIGAAAHVQELRYIAALHQTCLPETRDNGTISTADIQRLLKSRYNLSLNYEQAIEIVRGLGSGGHCQQRTMRMKPNQKKRKHQQSLQQNNGSNILASFQNSVMGNKKGSISISSHAKLDPSDSGVDWAEDSHSGGGGGGGTEQAEQEHWEVADLDEYLDLVQVLAILLIPTLARAGASALEKQQQQHRQLVQNPRQKLQPHQPFNNSIDPSSSSSHRQDEEGFELEQFTDDNHNQREEDQSSNSAEATADDDTRYSPLSPQPPHLLQDFVDILLQEYISTDNNDTTSSSNRAAPPVVDEDFVTNLLLQLGESERAQDAALISEMVAAAAATVSGSGGSSSIRAILDAQAMQRALTRDIQAWNVGSEDDESTLIQDVFGEEDITTHPTIEEEDASASRSHHDTPSIEDGAALDNDGISISDENTEKKTTGDKDNVERVNLNHTIVDFCIDAHSSVALVILIWIFYTVVSFTYISLFQATVQAPCELDEATNRDIDFGCRLSHTISSWLIVAVFLSLSGLVIIVPLSLGNNPNMRSSRRLFVPLVVSLIYTVVPYNTVNWYVSTLQEPYDTPVEKEVTRPFWKYFQHVVFAVGCSLVAIFWWQWGVQLLRESGFKGGITKLLVTSNVRGEGRLKRAATRKLNGLLLDALKMHPEPSGDNVSGSNNQTNSSSAAGVKDEGATSSNVSIRGKSGGTSSSARQTMLNYVLYGQQVETIGGRVWTFRQLFSGQFTEEHGIWIPTRTLSFQAAQVVISFLIATILLWIPFYAGDLADEAQRTLDKDTLPQWAVSIVPYRRDVYIALFPAASVAIFVMANLILLYIPSTTATVLKFRSGNIPSLGSPFFNTYRVGVDTVTMNLGNAIYGLFGSAFLFFLLVGLVIFLFIWDFSQPTMIKILTWGLGLTITILVKMILTTTCRQQFYRCFYRKHPRYANISSLALETWFIGLGGSVLIGRITQFLCAAVFFVGRIDVAFLAPDVNLLGYRFDVVPDSFIKDILSHEAHRHPYIERLAQMYLMKLKKNTRFVNRAGAAWRQVFVLVLMPWMSKYRIFSQERTIQAQAAFSKRKMELEEDAKGIVDRFSDDIVNVKHKIVDA